MSAIIYCLYLNRPERCRKRRIRGTRSMVHARSSNAAPLCHSVQYPDGLKLPAISEQNHRTACIPAHSGQRQRAFVLLSGFLFGFPIGEQNCAAPACKRKNHTPGSRCFIYHYQQHQSGLCHKLHPSTPSLAVPSVGSYPADPVFSGAFAGQYPALCRRTPHKGRTAFHAAKQPASGSQMNFKIIDTGIMDGF